MYLPIFVGIPEGPMKLIFNVYQICGGNPGQFLSETDTFIYGISPLHVQKPERSGSANKLKNYRIEHTRSNSIEKNSMSNFFNMLPFSRTK